MPSNLAGFLATGEHVATSLARVCRCCIREHEHHALPLDQVRRTECSKRKEDDHDLRQAVRCQPWVSLFAIVNSMLKLSAICSFGDSAPSRAWPVWACSHAAAWEPAARDPGANQEPEVPDRRAFRETIGQ